MTRFALASAPASEPVTRDEAKAHARISHDFEDTLIDRFITAARQRVEKDIERGIITQTWTATLDRWPTLPAESSTDDLPFWASASPTRRRITLTPYPTAITSVVVDGDAVDSDLYALRGDEIWIDEGVVDSTETLGGGIVITFTAGAATAAEDLKAATLLMFAHFYAVRETTSPQGIYHQIAPFGYDVLISPYKRMVI